MSNPRVASPQQRMLDLLSEVLAIARTISAPQTAASRQSSSAPGRGVYPHRSKYNPWRAYEWDRSRGRMTYLGAFPSIAKARAAQRAFRAGRPITEGTKTHLRSVA